jgi:hypothetical protein
MTRGLFFATAAFMVVVTADNASAQSTAPDTARAPSQQAVAGGAAGYVPYLTYVWNRTLVQLGVENSHRSETANQVRTADADAH